MKSLSPNLRQLIILLADLEYHSGNALGEMLGISRAAVWKQISQLEAMGLQIESHKGKGYRLLAPLILLDKKTIYNGLANEAIAERFNLQLFSEVDSTNQYLRNIKLDAAYPYHVCLSELQTAGKGRLAREWHSPFAQNIYLSFAYCFDLDVAELAGLSLAVSVTICEALVECTGVRALSIKWPNDILLEEAKLAGNLIEIQAESNGRAQVIIGVGVNVNMTDSAQPGITQAWTSLAQQTGESFDRNKIVTHLLIALHHMCEHFEKQGLSAFMQAWQARDALLGSTITLQQGEHMLQGTAMGINEGGQLLMQMDDGRVKAFSSGDTALIRKKA